ncbi:hypothetical protein INT45_007106 [Circinella minor]|uniref:F-box domain-containing protein n=1 Tax=Circinella minor TaxID=1195481 RepID=A0A8H7VNV5_9FUNG|nr:hypothetical protein INT45_007106 [Circinella minor]
MTDLLSRKRKCPSNNPLTRTKRSHNDKRSDFTQALLSNELVLHIFSYLSAKELTQCAKVNSSWYRLANDDLLWKLLFLRRFHNPLLVDLKEHPKLLKRWQERATHRDSYNSSNNNKRKRSEWKIIYKTNHNWRSGNCRMTYVDVDEEDKKLAPPDNNNNYNPTSSYVQFAHDILYIASTTVPLIEVWKVKNSGQPIMLRQLETATLNINQITSLKLDLASSPNIHRLVAGYTGGGFSVWEITFDNNSSSTTSDDIDYSSSTTCSATEVVIYIPKVRRRDHIISIGISYPMLLTCSSDMRLTAFCIDSSLDQRQAARFVYELKSHIRWDPMSVEIDRCNDENNRWRAMVCFGMPVGLNAYTVGIQEIILSKDTLISSRHCTALNQEDLFFTSSPFNHSTTPISEYSQQPITAVSYSEPYLITAHANNTIKQYYVQFSNNNKLEIIFAQTLYGHTSKVSALALDASIGRLVSGDKFGIKLWDVPCSGKRNNNSNNSIFMHDEPNNHSDDHATYYQRRHIAGTEYIVSIDGTAVGHDTLPFRDMEWLQFDTDKIVAVVRDERKKDSKREKFSVRIWSFSEGAI